MANKPEQRYELRSNSAEEEDTGMEQPPKENEQINIKAMMDAMMANFNQLNANSNQLKDEMTSKLDQIRIEVTDNSNQLNACLLYTSRCV